MLCFVTFVAFKLSGVIHTVEIVQSAPTVNLLYHISHEWSIPWSQRLFLTFLRMRWENQPHEMREPAAIKEKRGFSLAASRLAFAASRLWFSHLRKTSGTRVSGQE